MQTMHVFIQTCTQNLLEWSWDTRFQCSSGCWRCIKFDSTTPDLTSTDPGRSKCVTLFKFRPREFHSPKCCQPPLDDPGLQSGHLMTQRQLLARQFDIKMTCCPRWVVLRLGSWCCSVALSLALQFIPVYYTCKLSNKEWCETHRYRYIG